MFSHNTQAAKPLSCHPADNQKLLIIGMAPIRTWKNCIAICAKTQDQKET